jgi:peptidyl-prolyl cis-trans isomerase B (cyclophilin B)
MKGILGAALAVALVAGQALAQTGAPSVAAGPVVVVQTPRGVFEFVTFPDTAPKTVAQITGLAERGFYNGQIIHRVAEGFVVQFGDPQTKDPAKKAEWGTGGSGKPIGVAEISKKHTHAKKGTVAMAHSGDPARADSQLYVTLRPTPNLDSGYTVFGEIVSGIDVVEATKQGDRIIKVTVKGGAPAAK